MRFAPSLAFAAAALACTPPPPSGVEGAASEPTPTASAPSPPPAPTLAGAAASSAVPESSSADAHCRVPFVQAWTFARDDAVAHDHVKAWTWREGRQREHLIVGPDENGHQDARCYASGPHRGLNVERWCCRPSSPLDVRALKKEAPLSPGTIRLVRGHVVKRYRCPPCPDGARCKPCMKDNVVLSDEPELHERYDLDEGDTVVFTDDPERFELGEVVTLAVAVLSSRESNAPLHDLHLVAWR